MSNMTPDMESQQNTQRAPLLEAALLSMHNKASVIGPAMREAGFYVTTIDHFDTDSLGTFTGEIRRVGTMLDAALRKAKLATGLSGARYGLGSEGSFGPDPYLGMTPWGIEVIAWWDREQGYSVHEVRQGPETNYRQLNATDLSHAQSFAAQIGFPTHGIILGRPGEPHFTKTLEDETSLQQALDALLPKGPVWLETDMRAHRNPTRMAMIGQCAQALASRLATPCPACTAPGFGVVDVVRGAQCTQCGEPTQVVRAQVLSCMVCAHRAERTVTESAPPSRCDHCNP